MSGGHELVLTIEHPAGLHLRPAAMFVRAAARFKSQISIRNLSRSDAPEVDAKSMIGIMQSGVSQGHRVLVRAEGVDALEALATLEELVTSNFGDPQ